MAKGMSLAKIRAFDKRIAARHEAGHITYGEAKGMLISARLYKNPDPSKTREDYMNRKYWRGRATYEPVGFARLSKLEKAAFGLAGAIAENWTDDADLVMDGWENFGFSESDLKFIPPDWKDNPSSYKFVLAAVEEAIAVLSSNNKRLDEITEILIRKKVYNKDVHETGYYRRW